MCSHRLYRHIYYIIDMYEKRHRLLPEMNWSLAISHSSLYWAVEGTNVHGTNRGDCWKCDCVMAVRHQVTRKIQRYKEMVRGFRLWRQTIHNPNQLSKGIPQARRPKMSKITWLKYFEATQLFCVKSKTLYR